MANQNDDAPGVVHFPPEYGNVIGNTINTWASLEYHILVSIWALAEVRPAMGACMTSQIYTMNAKISALLALLRLRQAPQALIRRVNKFSEQVRGAGEIRNRVAHDLWTSWPADQFMMATMRITADKTLVFGAKPMPLKELQADLQKIIDRCDEAFQIRKSIEAALPSLPEMSSQELHPITETRLDP